MGGMEKPVGYSVQDSSEIQFTTLRGALLADLKDQIKQGREDERPRVDFRLKISSGTRYIDHHTETGTQNRMRLRASENISYRAKIHHQSGNDLTTL